MVFVSLYSAGILNPWRLWRRAEIASGSRNETPLDSVESNLSEIDKIQVLRFDVHGKEVYEEEPISLNEHEIKRVVDVLKRIGPFDTKKPNHESTTFCLVCDSTSSTKKGSAWTNPFAGGLMLNRLPIKTHDAILSIVRENNAAFVDHPYR